MKPRFTAPALLLIFSAVASPAFAHQNHSAAYGLAEGLAHPLGGWDHLLALLAIGIWSTQLGGRATWCVPGVFIGVMALAAACGRHFGIAPAFDQGAAASVVAIGLLIATAARLPLAGGAVLAAVFALFHGYTHGAESIPGHNFFLYGLGFVLTSVALHLAGIGIGRGATRLSTNCPRLLGCGLMAAGLFVIGW